MPHGGEFVALKGTSDKICAVERTEQGSQGRWVWLLKGTGVLGVVWQAVVGWMSKVLGVWVMKAYIPRI